MKSIFYKLLLLFPLIFSVSCSTSVKNEKSYFSGQIVNPKEQKIKIFKDDVLVYKGNFNANNEFSIKLDSLTEGLYTFRHGDEFQYLYIEPKDSIAMRLNTWDFDESLIFSGIGAEKNNYLMQLFLENEKEEKLAYQFYKLNETDFLAKTDSIINTKLKKYNTFRTKNKVSEKFNALVQIAIYYPIYSIKEKYKTNSTRFNKRNHTTAKPLSSSFYDYRAKTNINDTRFLSYYAFKNYIGNYLLNQANAIKAKDRSKSLSAIILKQINDKIKTEKLKNIMLHNAIINCLLDNKCCDKDKNEAKRIFYTNCTDKLKIKDVQTIVSSLDLLKRQTKFPSLEAVNQKGKTVVLNNLNSNKNIVFYFWPKEVNRIQAMLKRVQFLSKTHPDFTFIGLDNQLDNNKWKHFTKANKLAVNNQFQLVDKSQNKWFTNEIPRAVILNKKGVIMNDFSFLTHHNFERLLKKVEKNQ